MVPTTLLLSLAMQISASGITVNTTVPSLESACWTHLPMSTSLSHPPLISCISESPTSDQLLLLKCSLLHLFFKNSIYLAMPGLSCGMRDPPSSLQHVGSLVAACGNEFPEQGSSLGPLDGEHGVLATGPPGKSLLLHLK